MKKILKKSKLVNRFLKFKKINKTKRAGVYVLEQIKTDLLSLGIEKNDHVFIHSSLSNLGFIEGGPVSIIKALHDIVGEEGTLIFPSFSFRNGGLLDTIKDTDYTFDKKEEPSTVGVISEFFRTKKGVYRSNHPTHSISALGKHAEYLTSSHIETGSNFGKNTPFEKMLKLNVKMIGLGVKLPMFTFFHCIEDLNLELFEGLYHNDKISVQLKIENSLKNFEVSYHDPDFVTDRIERNPEIESFFTEYFINSGKLSSNSVGASESIMIRSQDFYQLTLELAKRNKTIYKI